MRQRILLSFLIFLLLVPPTVGTPQTSASAQLGFQASTQAPRWTDSYRKEILTKARDGDAGAQFWLGAAYGEGWFGNTDFPEALKWLRRSAARGNPDAQVSLGQMYEHGRGAKQNYKLAAKWCRMAAGHVPDFGGAGQGRNDLGLLYLEGLGVSKDCVRAYMWFSLANTETNLSEARAQMTPEQILKAERMVEEWKSHHPEH
jgi:TPR repeat protein